MADLRDSLHLGALRATSLALALALPLAGCLVVVNDPPSSNETSGTTGEGDNSGDGDGDPAGDGDGDATSGDGDGDATSGDGDGDATSGDGDGDPASGDGDGDTPSCVGVTPLADEPPDMTGDGDGDMTGDGDGDMTGDGDGDGGTTGDGDGDPEPPCPDCAPYWRLYDFQPQSCGYEWTYGLDSFEGHVTLVVLLAGWCSYCQAQASKLEQMRIELALEGYDAQFISINAISADDPEDQQNLVERCAFPLFQDTVEQSSWSAHGGGKDDMFIYAADGTLALELESGGELSTNLSTDEGYENVKQALIDAF